MDDLYLHDVVEAAARATINARCARAYMHDIRGTMQALYSGFELLSRSAKSTGENLPRMEKACDIAKRAITNHEKSMVGVMQQLTSRHTAPTEVDLGVLVEEVLQFLRNDAAVKEASFQFTNSGNFTVSAERDRLHLVILGLMTTAIDEMPRGSELCVLLARSGKDALLTIGSGFEFAEARDPASFWRHPEASLRPGELTLMFARQFLMANGGRLAFDENAAGNGALQIYYPCVASNA